MSAPAGRGGHRRDLWIVAAWWAGVTLLGEVLVGPLVRLYPEAASREGVVSDDAIFYLLRLVVPVVALVVILLVYSMVRFRARAGEEGDAPLQARGGRWAFAWLGVSAALTVSVIFYPGVTGLLEIWKSKTAVNPLTVEVVAQQWEWRFSYPELGIENAETLVLPKGRTVDFVITSKDVIHSFWVPSLRIKKDAIPGETRHLFLTPERLTSTEEDPMTRVQCAELCGIGHARMRADARVVMPADFEAWATAKANAAVPVSGSGTHRAAASAQAVTP